MTALRSCSGQAEVTCLDRDRPCHNLGEACQLAHKVAHGKRQRVQDGDRDAQVQAVSPAGMGERPSVAASEGCQKQLQQQHT